MVFKELVNLFSHATNGDRGKNGDLSQPKFAYEPFFDDPASPGENIVAVGLPIVDNRVWLDSDSDVVSFELGINVDIDGISHETTAHVFPGLSTKQFAQVKTIIESIHSCDAYGESPFYVRQPKLVTDSLKANSFFILAQTKDDANPIGYLHITPPEIESGDRHIGILVLNRYRKQGIAKHLFRYILENAQQFGFTKFLVTFQSENYAVKNFLSMIEKEFPHLVKVSRDYSDPQNYLADLEIL